VIRHWAIFGIVSLFALTAFGATRPQVDHIVVIKAQHKLMLLSGDQVVKTYSVALGAGGLEPKRRQGDNRTPEGIYHIDFRNAASHYHLALHVSYPDQNDRESARKRGVSPGGDIMIHGLGEDFRDLGPKHYLSNWTAGCIAVTDEEIEEIWRLVPDGTQIEIRP
jgi:murein L,D-transpeptidase YafK